MSGEQGQDGSLAAGTWHSSQLRIKKEKDPCSASSIDSSLAGK